jgi:hypothetical protein
LQRFATGTPVISGHGDYKLGQLKDPKRNKIQSVILAAVGQPPATAGIPCTFSMLIDCNIHFIASFRASSERLAANSSCVPPVEIAVRIENGNDDRTDDPPTVFLPADCVCCSLRPYIALYRRFPNSPSEYNEQCRSITYNLKVVLRDANEQRR